MKTKNLEDFSQLTPKAKRQLVEESRVMVLPEWDIDNANIFDCIRKEKYVQYKNEEEILQAQRGIKFSNDQQYLVIWF
ncbi:hypothetical protein ABXK36_38010, partial [Bacillus cereus]|uniref:hypothetical protein n=1 Tax=Bacillus cereus TaxID=1396 RepID=UPI0035F9BE5F